MPPIRAVLFDYGLVFTESPDPHAWRRMQSILNTDESSLHDVYWRHRHGYDLGLLSGPRYWQVVGDDLDRGTTISGALDALIDADIDMWTVPNRPMIDWASALQRSLVPTGVLSNIGDEMEEGIRRRCAWLDQFQHLTFSHRLGIAKPDVRIYREAIAGLGVPVEQTLFVDDRIENVEAARAVGLNAIQYVSHQDFLRDFAAGSFSGLPSPGAPASSLLP